MGSSPTGSAVIFLLESTLGDLHEYQAVQQTISATQAITDQEYMMVDATTANVVTTLPDATTFPGSTFNVKKIDASVHTVTVATVSGQTIDGASTFVISTQYGKVKVVSNGTNWYIF